MILDYKDIPVYYEDQGEGDVVVLIHGFLETASMWRDIQAEFSPNHRIITLDLLGHGQTGCLGYVHSMEMMAQTVQFILEQLHVERAQVIGHSMGGYVALALADGCPHLIESLCLMNSTPFADNAERRTNRERAIKAVKYHRQNFIGMSIANLFSPENRTLFTGEIEQIKLEAESVSIQGMVAALEGMKIRKDRSAVLKKLSIPKMVILGANDPIMPYHKIKPRLENLNIEIVKLLGGHMSYIENKTELLYSLKHFIGK